MNLRSMIESEYAKQSEGFAASRLFQSLEEGTATRADYDRFVANICKSHLKSPHILAFLYALAPPASIDKLKHNMLEELGLDEEGISHPGLLLELAEAAGFDEQQRMELDSLAQDELRRMCSDPILYGTLKEVGLSVLLETTCFEWMLSRLASRIARFLKEHRALSAHSLNWFTHHSEVDIRHAEEGLDAVVEYVQFYEIDPSDLQSILELTFRENVFIKRYFGEMALARETEMLS
jgi:pyrroloquinoline quinone (PQQ) biosynthesis protein C